MEDQRINRVRIGVLEQVGIQTGEVTALKRLEYKMRRQVWAQRCEITALKRLERQWVSMRNDERAAATVVAWCVPACLTIQRCEKVADDWVRTDAIGDAERAPADFTYVSIE